MKRMTTIFFMLLLFAGGMNAQTLTAFKGKVKDGYNFWFFQPKDTSEVKPLVVFLHGASLCGTNLNNVRRYGTIDAIEKGREVDAYVLAPQNPGGAWKPQRVMNIVDWIVANNNVDTTRVYVLGMSLGGYGTIDFAATYPEKVAAAIAMCGGGTVRDYSGLTQVPLWVLHGTADRAVSVRQSDKVVDEMKKVPGGAPLLHYDRIPGMNHSALARAFYMKETYEWLFEHTLADTTRVLAPTFTVTNATLRTAYRDLSKNKRPNLVKFGK